MAQSKHILLLVRAWGKRSSHSVDWGHAPPAASHSPWPRFVPASISEFLFKSCSVSWFFSYIIPSFPLFFQLTFCPQTAARSAHTPLVSALLPLSAPPSARGLHLPCSSHQAPSVRVQLDSVWDSLHSAWHSLGRYRASSRKSERVTLLLRQALQKELLPPEGVPPACASSWWMQNKHIF